MSDALPELPTPGVRDLSGQHYVGYTADQMREYARQAVLAEIERRAKKWEEYHGHDKYGVAAFIRGEPER
jgi:hypothetical protein